MKPFDLTGAVVACLVLAGCAPQGAATHRAAQPGRVTVTKRVDVFGVLVYATGNVADDKMLHAASVLAQYLDNDEDGVPDDLAVLEAMTSRGAALVMGKDETEQHAIDRSSLSSGVIQDLWDEETRPGGAERNVFDASLEEVLHLVTDAGYGVAYPEAFATRPGTRIAEIMDEARGGRFKEVPERYPESAWYTYYDETCKYDCQVSEYFYWALTSILGAQSLPGRLEEIQQEWRFNTPEKVKEGDPKIYALLTDPEYGLPSRLPDGQYAGGTLTVETLAAE